MTLATRQAVSLTVTAIFLSDSRTCSHLPRARGTWACTWSRLPVTHDPPDTRYAAVADAIGRMTPARCETTAHRDGTAQARVTSRGDCSPPCPNRHGDTLFRFARRHRSDPKARRGIQHA